MKSGRKFTPIFTPICRRVADTDVDLRKNSLQICALLSKIMLENPVKSGYNIHNLRVVLRGGV